MIKSISTRLAAWRLHRETMRELSMLNDRELADLGIGRGDIPFVADGSLRDADVAYAPLRHAMNDAGANRAAHVSVSLAA